MQKKFGSQDGKIGGTSFIEMKNNYWGIILGLGQKSLGIFEQNMTQRNYEN